MRTLRTALPVAAAIIATWWLTTASAQTSIPNGVFVRESSGFTWLILDGKKVAVPIWRDASDADINGIPSSQQYAVMNAAGQIVAGEIPAWAARQPLPGRGIPIDGVEGQQATASALLSGQPFRATVRSIMTVRLLSSTKHATDTRALQFDDRWPVGMFVMVESDVENVGLKPSIDLPPFRLRDERGRQFSGETHHSNDKVSHARFWYFPSIQWEQDEYQPNLPKRRVFVYDVPTDATGLTLVADR